jgi:preprotein translocase subunit SecD
MTVGLSVAGAAIATTGVLVAIVLGFSDTNTSPRPGQVEGVERDLTPTRDLGPRGLQDSANILQSRLQALDVHDPSVVPDQGFLRAYVPAASLGALTAVATTQGILRFRQALAMQSSQSGPTVSPSPHSVTHSPTLSTKLLHTFAAWSCKQSLNPTRGREAASDYMIACASDGSTTYLLAPTAVTGHDISSVAAGLDAQPGSNDWVVKLTFDRSGSRRWLKVTKRASKVNGGQPSTSCAPPKGCNAIAITLDGVVQSAPYISTVGGIPGGHAEISDDFTKQSASQLAAVLKYGALPTAFAVRKPATSR